MCAEYTLRLSKSSIEFLVNLKHAMPRHLSQKNQQHATFHAVHRIRRCG